MRPFPNVSVAPATPPAPSKTVTAANSCHFSLLTLSCREITPSDGHPVLAVSWSPSGDAFLCVTGSAQPRFYDRDGKLLGECARGDMYIRDMKNTKGHITGCSGGCWHPIDRFTAVTSSEDGTVRWVLRCIAGCFYESGCLVRR
jgi:WD40 repeat protein